MLTLEALALGGLSAPEPACEVLREIVATDLPMLAQEMREKNWARALARAPSAIQQLRMGHQQLAQLLGRGVDAREAAFALGRSVHSVNLLLQDPAFKDLVEYYRQQSEERQFDAYGRLVTLGGTALEILQERLEEAPERFTNNELRQIIESTMDRSAAPARGAGERAGSGRSEKGFSLHVQFVTPQAAGASEPPKLIEAQIVEEPKNG